MSNTQNIEIDVESSGETTLVRPRGEIDLAAAPALKRRIEQAQQSKPARLVIDLGDVPYMDSSGVATLVEAMQAARRAGGKLVLCRLQERVRSVFEISRLDTVFTIADSTEAALEA